MPISSRWFQGAMLTYLFGFTVLGMLAYLVYRDQPPIPAKTVAGKNVLFTRDDIFGGMNVFQRYALMEYGSVYGHGAYLGPDFTAEYLHNSAEFLVKGYAGAPAEVFQRASGSSRNCTRTLTTRQKIRLSGAGQEKRRIK
jgi:nitric oxide reductase subunit B